MWVNGQISWSRGLRRRVEPWNLRARPCAATSHAPRWCVRNTRQQCVQAAERIGDITQRQWERSCTTTRRVPTDSNGAACDHGHMTQACAYTGRQSARRRRRTTHDAVRGTIMGVPALSSTVHGQTLSPRAFATPAGRRFAAKPETRHDAATPRRHARGPLAGIGVRKQMKAERQPSLRPGRAHTKPAPRLPDQRRTGRLRDHRLPGRLPKTAFVLPIPRFGYPSVWIETPHALG